MGKKIPTHQELKAKREQEQRVEMAARRELLKRVLAGKIVRTTILSALTIEAHDYLQPTTFYSKKLKRDGDRFISELEKVVEKELMNLYDMNQDFTWKIMNDIEAVINLLCEFDLGQFPNIKNALTEFKKNQPTLNINEKN